MFIRNRLNINGEFINTPDDVKNTRALQELIDELYDCQKFQLKKYDISG